MEKLRTITINVFFHFKSQLKHNFEKKTLLIWKKMELLKEINEVLQ